MCDCGYSPRYRLFWSFLSMVRQVKPFQTSSKSALTGLWHWQECSTSLSTRRPKRRILEIVETRSFLDQLVARLQKNKFFRGVTKFSPCRLSRFFKVLFCLRCLSLSKRYTLYTCQKKGLAEDWFPLQTFQSLINIRTSNWITVFFYTPITGRIFIPDAQCMVYFPIFTMNIAKCG